jgi:hypothetical protein
MLDEDPVAQAKGLVHLVAIMIASCDREERLW